MLQKKAPQATSQQIFTCDLSVNEFLLVREAGYDSVGLVMGSSIYHIGYYQRGNLYQNQEMTILTQAMYNARQLALKDMTAEARGNKADGIVGVRLEITQQELGESMAEFIAIGTAIRSHKRRSSDGYNLPFFTSDLSGQDFWMLLHAGYYPVGLVMGNCVYHVVPQGIGQRLSQFSQNVEIPNYTNAFYSARQLAMGRMKKEAQRLKAKGIVGMHLHMYTHGWSSNIIEFFAVGTAIIPISDRPKVPTPLSTVLLNDQAPGSLKNQ